MALGERLKPLVAFSRGLVAFSVIFLVGVNPSHLGLATLLVCGLGFTAPLVAI